MMHKKTDRKTRGRTSITGSSSISGPNKTNPDVPIRRRSEASRPVNAGTGKHRGDRRDMNKAYTGNAKHKARGNSPRVNVATRKN